MIGDWATLAHRRRSPGRDVLRRMGATAIQLAVALWMMFGACGAAIAAVKTFSIQTSDAVTALAEFGSQAGSEILFEYDRIKGRSTHPISGQYEPLEALRLMTAGTELRVSQSADGVFVVECDCRASTRDGSQPSASRGSEQRPARASAETSPSANDGSRLELRRSPSGTTPGSLEELIITGSRIRQDPLSSPMPLVAISRAQLQDSGVENVADAIVQLPSISVGTGLSNSRQAFIGAGASLISLRDLGTNRTLVLVNGRRQVSGSPLSAAVDLNTIPAELVDRLEVVTSGTSAVYGADAIGGVVNVILRKDYAGVSLRAAGGITSRGDGASRGFSLTAGRNFELNGYPGNALVSFVYDD